MSPQHRFFLCVVGVLLSSASALYSSDSSVQVVNYGSDLLDVETVGIVEFYAPWCGHCKALAPEFERAAAALKGVVPLLAVDCDAHQALCSDHGVQGFPTLKMIVAGKVAGDYEGPREASGIIQQALKAVGELVQTRFTGKPSGGGGGQAPTEVVELTDDDFDDAVLAGGEYWLVEFYAPWCGHCKKLAPEWQQAAARLKGRANLAAVDATEQRALAARYGIEGFPTIIEFWKGEQAPYEGSREADGIVEFVESKLGRSPLPLAQLTGAAAMHRQCTEKQICIIAFLPHILDSMASGRNEYLAVLGELAEEFAGRPWGIVWSEAGVQASLESSLEVGGYGYPAVLAVSPNKGRGATFSGAFDAAGLRRFVSSVLSGKVATVKLPALGHVDDAEPWNGEDGEMLEEDEFDLSELMADD